MNKSNYHVLMLPATLLGSSLWPLTGQTRPEGLVLGFVPVKLARRARRKEGRLTKEKKSKPAGLQLTFTTSNARSQGCKKV